MLEKKLIAYFENKYNLSAIAEDVYEVDPTTGVGRKPRFRNGQLVRHRLSGREARYLTPAIWLKGKNTHLIHYLDNPLMTDKGEFNYTYIDDDLLETVEK